MLGDRPHGDRRGRRCSVTSALRTSFIGPGASRARCSSFSVPGSGSCGASTLERIRLEERAEVAARIHDSVLQTLALVQRHADDPTRVAAARAPAGARAAPLALRQRRSASAATLADALAEAAAEVEELHGVRIELASAGDAAARRLVAAARARCARGDDERSQVLGRRRDLGLRRGRTATQVAVFVRDRGIGFDRAAVPADRRGARRVDRGPHAPCRRLRHDRLARPATAPRSS